ncbi:MAG: tetratricopeptide repeat protein [Bacteroidota bacterium]|nr:tetratricopeptide repeat protein [Bacteroidota bacterium]
MKRFLLFGFLMFILAKGFASDQDVFIKQANKAYSEGMYAQAADLYKKVLILGYEAPELYYNLGNTYFKMNDYSSAILYFEKAHKLDPGNEDINFNLQVANSKISDKIEPLPVLFYVRWYNALVEIMPVDGWAWFGCILFIISLFTGLLYFLSRVLIIRKIGFWGAIAVLGLSLLSFLFAYQEYRTITHNPQAIVFTPTVTVKSSPDEKSVDLFVIHEGTKVQLMDNIGTWYEIRITNGSVGWVPVSVVQKI